MPGLVRGVARTAVVAGTATAVSGRVSRRQQGKWAEQEQAQAPQEQYQEPQYAPPPPAPTAAPEDDMMDQLEKLGALHEKGILTDEEFSAQKAKILNA